MNSKIAITSLSTISALGSSSLEVWNNYLNEISFIKTKNIEGFQFLAASLNLSSKDEVFELQSSNIRYQDLDPSVIYAILTSRKAVKQAGWKHQSFGINFGSSRGATTLFENYHSEFLKTDQSSTLASPTTTLGNISSWIAQDLSSLGPEISHSITCSSALHAIINGVAWLQSGLSDHFIVGASEAPLTSFTIAQMKALKIYAQQDSEFPCRTLDFNKTTNTMVLGEGAGACCLELGNPKNALAYISGIGYATEKLQHNISISENGECLQKSMKMALKNHNLNEIDVVVMHAPGTVKGDLSEFRAIQNVFGANIPFITSNKWKLGHTFGASGILSLDLAIMMIQHQMFVGIPFTSIKSQPKKINKVLINAVGFGGNAVSVLIEKA